MAVWELLAKLIKEQIRNCVLDVVTMSKRGVHLDSVTVLLVISCKYIWKIIAGIDVSELTQANMYSKSPAPGRVNIFLNLSLQAIYCSIINALHCIAMS